jgi:hypothetical protein
MSCLYECLSCHNVFTGKPGSVSCTKCKHVYVRWANYEQWRELNPDDYVIENKMEKTMENIKIEQIPRVSDFLRELRNACSTVFSSQAEGLNLDWVRGMCDAILEDKKFEGIGTRTAYLKDKDYK